ncbi:MAG: glutamine amidotransferase [Actinobacteria bacterium]|nr:glutamine amidotransferase [Actinomycetota bacterium]MCL6105055.1 glutamine amidotransferase [Actinomycetota bacterium]
MKADIQIVNVYPDLLGTYGDRGNSIILAKRLSWRGVKSQIIDICFDQPLPKDAQIYCLGGGEDVAQVSAAKQLSESSNFDYAIKQGAVLLAVCAGFQIIGGSFPDLNGSACKGIGILDANTFKNSSKRSSRAVGEVVADPSAGLGLATLIGFENHSGLTRLGNRTTPLGSVRKGVGNGYAKLEGAIDGHVVGTYLHGPVLARNPTLADMLLSWVVDDPLPELDDSEIDQLRAHIRN